MHENFVLHFPLEKSYKDKKTHNCKQNKISESI